MSEPGPPVTEPGIVPVQYFSSLQKPTNQEEFKQEASDLAKASMSHSALSGQRIKRKRFRWTVPDECALIDIAYRVISRADFEYGGVDPLARAILEAPERKAHKDFHVFSSVPLIRSRLDAIESKYRQELQRRASGIIEAPQYTSCREFFELRDKLAKEREQRKIGLEIAQLADKSLEGLPNNGSADISAPVQEVSAQSVDATLGLSASPHGEPDLKRQRITTNQQDDQDDEDEYDQDVNKALDNDPELLAASSSIVYRAADALNAITGHFGKLPSSSPMKELAGLRERVEGLEAEMAGVKSRQDRTEEALANIMSMLSQRSS